MCSIHSINPNSGQTILDWAAHPIQFSFEVREIEKPTFVRAC